MKEYTLFIHALINNADKNAIRRQISEASLHDYQYVNVHIGDKVIKMTIDEVYGKYLQSQ